MEIFFDREQLLLRRRVRSWVEKNLLFHAAGESDVYEEGRRLLGQLGEAGFTAYVAPKRFGGVRERVYARDLCLLREELARGSSLADAMFAIQALGSYPITLAGTQQQKSRFLPSMASAKAICAFALTEPQAGSDISSVRTRAVKRGSKYVLRGVKSFISNAGLADVYVVFALTEPQKKAKGLTAFVVEAGSPGFVFKGKTPLLSPHPLGMIAFEDCGAELLGHEGEGLKIALATLDILRCTVGAAAVGLAQRAMEEALPYSQKRVQFGQRLSQFQAIQIKLADMATALEAARLLVYQAAWMSDHGKKEAKQKSSMAKLFATEAAQRIIDDALQIHGGMGVVVGTPVEQLYRDIRALRIYEGTSEIQKLVIAKTLLDKA